MEYYDDEMKEFEGVMPDLLSMISGITGIAEEFGNGWTRKCKMQKAECKIK